jgi:hypothetical protein
MDGRSKVGEYSTPALAGCLSRTEHKGPFQPYQVSDNILRILTLGFSGADTDEVPARY